MVIFHSYGTVYQRLTVAITTMATMAVQTHFSSDATGHSPQGRRGVARESTVISYKRGISTVYLYLYHIISYKSIYIYAMLYIYAIYICYIYIYIYTIYIYAIYIYTCIYIYIYPYTRGTWMYMVSAHGNTIKHNTIRPLCFFLECHTCSPGISWEHDAFGFLPDLDFCMHSFNPFLLGYLGIIIYLQPQVSPAILLS